MYTLLLFCLALSAPHGQITLPVVELEGEAASFAALGDWGRQADMRSVTPRAAGGFDDSGWCTNNFADAAEEKGPTGAGKQRQVAEALNRECGRSRCRSIINTGDSFYECGVDDPSRWKTDWQDVYQTPQASSNSGPCACCIIGI